MPEVTVVLGLLVAVIALATAARQVGVPYPATIRASWPPEPAASGCEPDRSEPG
jgi:hypothetical protein